MIKKEKDKWTAVPEPARKSRFKAWMVWVPLAAVLFADTFLYGFRHILDEPDPAEIETFTAEDANRMLTRVQEDFAENVSYQTSEISGPNELATGEKYYAIFYVVTTESDPNVYKYVFWKYAADFEDHKKGDIVLISCNITDEYTKEEVLDVLNGIDVGDESE